MTGQVLCDRCGKSLLTLAGARVFFQQDELGRVVAVGVSHQSCVEGLRQQLERGSARDREAIVLDEPGEAFLDVARVRSLRATARSHSASASRVLAKLKRLWMRQMGQPDVRRRPVFGESR